MEKDIRYVRSAIEDLAFTSCSSRVTIWGYPHIVGDVVLSTTLPKEQRCGQAREQRLEWKRLGVNARSSEPPRIALRTCLMDMEHTENYAHTKWKRTILIKDFPQELYNIRKSQSHNIPGLKTEKYLGRL